MKNYSYICKCDKYRKKKEYKILVEKWKLEENSHLLHPFLFSTHKYKKGGEFSEKKMPKWEMKIFYTREKKVFLRLLTARRAGKNGGFHAACMHGMGKLLSSTHTIQGRLFCA